jgi:O-antigen/teichoic acid export membrane protein
VSTPTFGGRLRAVAVPLSILRGLGQAAEFAGWIVVARTLGAYSFGQLSIFFLVCRYSGLVADWGASYRGSRDVAAGWHGSVHFLLRRRLLLAFGLAALAAGGASASGFAELAPLAVVTLALGSNRDWIALGREQGLRAGSPAAVQGIVIGVGALLVHSVTEAALVVAVGYGLGACISVVLNPRYGRAKDFEDPPRTDGWMLVAVLAAQVTSTFDILLLGLMIGATDAGIYAAVYRVPNAVLALLSILFAGFLPLATALRFHDRDAYRRLLRRSLKISGISGVALAVCAPVAAILVPAVFGHAYRSGSIPLLILMVATALATFAAPLHSFAQATARDRGYSLILSLAAAFNLAGNLIFIPMGGMRAAASVTLGTQGLLVLLLGRFVRHDLRHTDSD